MDEILTEVKDYCGISGDYADDTVILPLMNVAYGYVAGVVGGNIDVTDNKVKMLIKLIVNDLYTNRELVESNKMSGNTRRIVEGIAIQLQLENRRKEDT